MQLLRPIITPGYINNMYHFISFHLFRTEKYKHINKYCDHLITWCSAKDIKLFNQLFILSYLVYVIELTNIELVP